MIEESRFKKYWSVDLRKYVWEIDCITEEEKQEILSNQEKAKKWDNYYEPQYEMRPTYQELEKIVKRLDEEIKHCDYLLGVLKFNQRSDLTTCRKLIKSLLESIRDGGKK